MFYELLKIGKEITISDNKGCFMPSTFFVKGNKVLVRNAAIGVSDAHNEESVEEHICNMILEGFTVTIN